MKGKLSSYEKFPIYFFQFSKKRGSFQIFVFSDNNFLCSYATLINEYLKTLKATEIMFTSMNVSLMHWETNWFGNELISPKSKKKVVVNVFRIILHFRSIVTKLLEGKALIRNAV